MNTGKTIENQLFSWEGWDEVEIGVFIFTKVILKRLIGRGYDTPCFEIGHHFSHAVFDTQNSTVTFFDNETDEKGHKFELLISIGKEIK